MIPSIVAQSAGAARFPLQDSGHAEQIRAMFWDRRKKDRREQKGAKNPDEERRGTSEKPERRQWTCGILYKTSISVAEIEAWLEANAEEQWAVGLDSIEEGLAAKVLKIMFKNQADKVAFVEAFARRR